MPGSYHYPQINIITFLTHKNIYKSYHLSNSLLISTFQCVNKSLQRRGDSLDKHIESILREKYSDEESVDLNKILKLPSDIYDALYRKYLYSITDFIRESFWNENYYRLIANELKKYKIGDGEVFLVWQYLGRPFSIRNTVQSMTSEQNVNSNKLTN